MKSFAKKLYIFAAFIIAPLPLLSACKNAGENKLIINYFLGTNFTINLQDGNSEKTEREILKFLNEFEEAVSVHISSSEVSRFNAAEANVEVKLSADVYTVAQMALQTAEKSKAYHGGSYAYDPTLYRISELWGFKDGENIFTEGKIPPENEIASLLKQTGAEKIVFTNDGIYKSADGAALDLGGIAKGYALDKCVQIARKNGTTSGIIIIAGNVYAIGSHIGENRDFNIKITHPRYPGFSHMKFAKLSVSDTSVSVSGDYERYFIENGIRYCHILDPATGRPVDNGIISVVTVGKNGALMDSYSTAAMVLGVEKGLQFLKDNNVDGIIITENRYYLSSDKLNLSEIDEGFKGGGFEPEQ